MMDVEEIEQFILDAGSDNLTVFGGSHAGGVFCQQNSDELADLIHTILETGEPINTYLELGAAAGGSVYIINHFFNPAKLVMVDDGQHPRAWMRKTILQGLSYSNIAGISYSESVIEAAAKFAPYDLIFVDADHTYPSVRADVTLYLPLLRPGGFMAMHDSIYFGGDVGRVVRELRADPQVEFIAEFVSKKYEPLGTALFRKAADAS
jgi:predicted O-methyltransferase YrrM